MTIVSIIIIRHVCIYIYIYTYITSISQLLMCIISTSTGPAGCPGPPTGRRRRPGAPATRRAPATPRCIM